MLRLKGVYAMPTVRQRSDALDSKVRHKKYYDSIQSRGRQERSGVGIGLTLETTIVKFILKFELCIDLIEPQNYVLFGLIFCETL